MTIKKTYGYSLNLFSLRLIATVPYVGKRLHLDPDPEPDPKLIPDPDMQIISDPAGSGSTTLQGAVENFKNAWRFILFLFLAIPLKSDANWCDSPFKFLLQLPFRSFMASLVYKIGKKCNSSELARFHRISASSNVIQQSISSYST